MLSNLSWAIHYLRKHAIESFLIILTMAIGVAVLTTVLTVFMGLSRQMDSFLDDSHYRMFTVTGQSDEREMNFRSAPPIMPYEEFDTQNFTMDLNDLGALTENLPAETIVFPTVQNNSFKVDSIMDEISVIGTNDAFNDFYQLSLSAGSWFLENDVQESNSVIVLNSHFAERLFGSTDVIGEVVSLTNQNTTLDYTVIGVLDREMSELSSRVSLVRELFIAYVPIGSPLFPNPTFTALSIGVTQGVNPTILLEQIRSFVDLQFDGNAAVTGNLAELQETSDRLIPILRTVGLFASIGLIISVVNILNLMLARVLRRVKHVGIHMALGSTRLTLVSRFLIEAILLAVVSSIIGVFISCFIELLLLNTWNVLVYPISMSIRIIIGLGIGIISSVLFEMYPAIQIANIDIGLALREEGLG